MDCNAIVIPSPNLSGQIFSQAAIAPTDQPAAKKRA
jgi:hypothetical protein